MKNKLRHIKTATLALLVSVGVSSCESLVPPPVDPEAVAIWDCYEFINPGFTPIVQAWFYEASIAHYNLGKIKANGIVKNGGYHAVGLSHHWDFDLRDDGTHESLFIIEPDGTGKYYFFSNDEKKTMPKLILACKKSK